jgi:transcriptional regulator with XRE-family HTH domain
MSQKRAVNVIHRLRELGLTYKDFADAAGVSERAVAYWFSYEREPKMTFAQVASVCDLLQWTAQQLAAAYEPAATAISAEEPGSYTAKKGAT